LSRLWPNLHRLVLTLHFSGKSLANDHRSSQCMGVVISKRQVVRLLTAKLETFRARMKLY